MAPLPSVPQITPLKSTYQATVTPPVPSRTSVEELTATVSAKPLNTPVLTPILFTPTPVISPSPTLLCNLAVAGRPIDITIPDNTRIGPGETFIKTWRLVNGGSCPWTRSYSVIWFSGDNLAYRKSVPIRTTVLPGQSVDISVDLVAPQAPGIFQSNWKLRDPTGQLFGIGPGGGSPIWARIEVIVTETLTPTLPLATVTSIPQIHSSGKAILDVGETFDLDGALQGPGAGDDFALQMTDGQIDWLPKNGARVAVFGLHPPQMADCHDALTANTALRLTPELIGNYLCIRTDLGLPASLFLTRIDPAGGSIEFIFTVWSIP